MLLEASPSLIGVRNLTFMVAGDVFPLVAVSFDAASFALAAFDLAGIECPPSIARSVIKRQAEFYFGRVAAKLALAAFACESENIAIGSSRQPIWPSGMLGSISHAAGLAVAVVVKQGPCRGVGVDVEQVIDAARCAAIAHMIAGEDELTLVSTGDHTLSRETALTIVFSGKESFFKGVFAHVGRYFDFTAVRLIGCDPASRYLRIAVTESLSDELVAGREFVIQYGFIEPDTVVTFFAW